MEFFEGLKFAICSGRRRRHDQSAEAGVVATLLAKADGSEEMAFQAAALVLAPDQIKRIRHVLDIGRQVLAALVG